MSNDLIRRSDAIETAYQLRHKPNDAEWEDWLKSFNAIPSADRSQGEWKSVKASIYPYGYDVECSVCGHRMGSSFGYKFCPMCGAKMKGADDE